MKSRILLALMFLIPNLALAQDASFFIQKAANARLDRDRAKLDFERLAGEYFAKECPRNYFDDDCDRRTRRRAESASGISIAGAKVRKTCGKLGRISLSGLSDESKYELNEACGCKEDGTASKISSCLKRYYAEE